MPNLQLLNIPHSLQPMSSVQTIKIRVEIVAVVIVICVKQALLGLGVRALGLGVYGLGV